MTDQTIQKIDVVPTAEVIFKMAENLRLAAAELESIAERTKQTGDFFSVPEVVNCVVNLMSNLRLDLLVTRPLRQFGAV